MTNRSRFRAVSASLAIALSSSSALTAAPHDFHVGDVVCGVTSGNYQVYNNAGGYIETIYNGLGGVTTGSYFLDDPSDPPGLLYTTDFSFGDVVVLDGASGHAVIQVIDTGPGGGWAPESICFDEEDEFYVGHANGDQDIQKYDSAGLFLGDYDVAIGPAGADWVDVACDQTTMFYTSEGSVVRRYDLATSTQLPDFATGLPNDCFALRLLPPFDGTGGLIVANRSSVLRLDDTGSVVQVYDAAGEDFWFSANLDPNGTSFWSGDLGTANFYRFDIATGAVEIGPINTGTGYGTLVSISVVGEPTGGSNDAPIFQQAPCSEVINVLAGETYCFVVAVIDPDPGDSITLTVSGMPPGAIHTPALPLAGAPDEDLAPVFCWTPTVADVGSFTLSYLLTDAKGAVAECTVTINVAEGYLVVGPDPGADTFTNGGFTFATHISNIRDWHLISTRKSPVFQAPDISKTVFGDGQVGNGGTPGRRVVDTFRVQALLYDPVRFPANPEQFSTGLTVSVYDTGRVSATPYGNRDGLQLGLEVFVGPDQKRYYRFPLTIDGL
jgi:hypothetical protein